MRWREDGAPLLDPGDKVRVVVYVFPNGMVATCDLQTGKQIPELQGRKSEALAAIHQAVGEGKIVIGEWKE